MYLNLLFFVWFFYLYANKIDFFGKLIISANPKLRFLSPFNFLKTNLANLKSSTVSTVNRMFKFVLYFFGSGKFFQFVFFFPLYKNINLDVLVDLFYYNIYNYF